MFFKIFLTFSLNVKIFCIILLVLLNIIMALNNVMQLKIKIDFKVRPFQLANETNHEHLTHI
jgi:hypothetical protein